ncbi:M48 family metallopeptidase [Clostridium butyricum]|uniref:M48 family metallopeptidase n=1 Tax=Clostridium butyricum TaxID=1492 RepID=UPI003D34F903
MMIVSGIPIEIVKKNIKNIHLGVYPPEGKVRVAAPLNTNDETIRLLVISRLSWIKKQREKFLTQDRQSKREYVSGESIYLWGQRYLLKVIDNKGYSKVKVENKKYINLYIKKESTVEQREKVINNWYRKQLKKKLPDVLEKYSQLIGVNPSDYGVRIMRTKWGACNTETGRISVNLNLVKRPKNCLEYVVTHELIHLIERHHNERFKELLDKYYPGWRVTKDELNKFILEHI